MGKYYATLQQALEAEKQKREEEANLRGYRISWDSNNNKVTIMSPYGDGGVFNLYKFLMSKQDIKTFFNINF